MNLFLLYPGLCCSLRQTWRSSFAEGPQTRNRLSIILSLKLLKTQPGSICSARLRIRVSLSDCSLLVRSTSSSFPPLIFTSSWIVSVLKLVPLPLPPSPVLSPFCHHFFLFLFLAIYWVFIVSSFTTICAFFLSCVLTVSCVFFFLLDTIERITAIDLSPWQLPCMLVSFCLVLMWSHSFFYLSAPIAVEQSIGIYQMKCACEIIFKSTWLKSLRAKNQMKTLRH